jgi:plastocyanin
MFNQHLLVAVSAATLALTVACSSGGSAAPARSQGNASAPPTGAQQLTVRGLDAMRFEPAQLTVRAGQPVQLTFENAGATIHDFTLTNDQGVAQKVQAVAQGKTTSVATFTIERPGTYTFVCEQPGHAPAGMRGTIVVQ